MTNPFVKALLKFVKYVVVMGIPFVLFQYPDLMNVTIGGVLLGLLSWAKGASLPGARFIP